MNIAIVANKHFTIFFARIAPELERAGHRLFWISPSHRWTRWLVSQGMAPEAILSLPNHAREWRSMVGTGPETLADLEVPSGLTISNVILMCRSLRRVPAARAYAYLSVCRRHVDAFLAKHDIEVSFGEATWGLEILIWMLGQKSGIPYLHPTTTRIPDDRFAFFDALPHQIVELRPVTQQDRLWAAEYLAHWVERPQRPVFSTTMPSPLSLRPYWLEELRIAFCNPALNRDDLTLWPMVDRIGSRLKTAANRILLRFQSPFCDAGPRSFVLVCLHQQPEASIDVYGRLHSDQAHFVERLVRLIPSTHEVWVKEHIDALGARPTSWLNRLRRLPNVRLIDPRVSTFELLRRADLVISTTGTVSYEAALLGTPAIAAAPIFFTPLMALDSSQFPDPITWPWRDLLPRRPEEQKTRQSAVEFLAWVHAQSFPGMPFDPVTLAYAGRDPNSLTTEAEGFVHALMLPTFPRRGSRGNNCPQKGTSKERVKRS